MLTEKVHLVSHPKLLISEHDTYPRHLYTDQDIEKQTRYFINKFHVNFTYFILVITINEIKTNELTIETEFLIPTP